MNREEYDQLRERTDEIGLLISRIDYLKIAQKRLEGPIKKFKIELEMEDHTKYTISQDLFMSDRELHEILRDYIKNKLYFLESELNRR